MVKKKIKRKYYTDKEIAQLIDQFEFEMAIFNANDTTDYKRVKSMSAMALEMTVSELYGELYDTSISKDEAYWRYLTGGFSKEYLVPFENLNDL